MCRPPCLGPIGVFRSVQLLDYDPGLGQSHVVLCGGQGNGSRPGDVHQDTGRQSGQIIGSGNGGLALAPRDRGRVVLQLHAHSTGRACIGRHHRVRDPVDTGFSQGEGGRARGMGDGGSLLHLIGVEAGVIAGGCQGLGPHIGGVERVQRGGCSSRSSGPGRTFRACGSGGTSCAGRAGRTSRAVYLCTTLDFPLC